MNKKLKTKQNAISKIVVVRDANRVPDVSFYFEGDLQPYSLSEFRRNTRTFRVMEAIIGIISEYDFE